MNALSDITAAESVIAVSPSALILPGGNCSIFCFADLDAPLAGTAMLKGDGNARWTARFWPHGNGHSGIALVGAASLGNLDIVGEADATDARIGTPAAVSTDAAGLAEHLRATDAPLAEVLHFLADGLTELAASENVSRFQAALLRETSEADGFVEVVVKPDCGGLFLQGWAHTSLSGTLSLLGPAEGIDATAATFCRDDILAPAAGFCMFVKDWAGRLDDCGVLFVEHDRRLLRLDILSAASDPITGAAGGDHVRAMLHRLTESGSEIEPFKRIIRPRFEGTDTLASHNGPITAAIDRILHTPSGGLFVTGWLLDPLDQVERAILKSTGNLYAPLHDAWHRTDRPDLNEAFAADPRFAGLLDPRERLHGFTCTVEADPAKLNGVQAYLELVLKDDRCLFLPCDLTPCDGPGAAHPVLAALQPHDPALGALIANHAAPFLATVPCPPRGNSRLTVQPLAGGPAGRSVAAVVPVTEIAHMQPIMARLAGTAEAGQLDLILVAGRGGAAALAEMLDDQFRFFGLKGALVLVPDHDTLAARLDAGAAVTDAPDILVWHPSVLPHRSGWLDVLRAGASGLQGPSAVAPLLSYEDGSVYFGGHSTSAPPKGAICAMVGFERRRVEEGHPRPARAVPAEIALLRRDLLDAAGGFRGGLWGDRFIGQDLSQRLAQNGTRLWCIPEAEFWMLDTVAPQGDPAERDVVDRIDAALIALARKRDAQQAQEATMHLVETEGDRT